MSARGPGAVLRRAHRTRRRLVNLRHVWTHTDWARVRSYRAGMSGSPRLPLGRLLRLQWRHGASPDDALVLDLLGEPDCVVSRRVTRSRRHEFTMATSDPAAWHDLADKARFASLFRDLLGRRVLTGTEGLAELRRDPSVLGPELVVKLRLGQSGAGHHFLPAAEALSLLASGGQDLLDDVVVEPVVTAHPEIDRLLPGVLHTLRVCTLLTADGAEVWPAVLRIGAGGTDPDGRPTRIDSTTSGAVTVAVDPDGRLAPLGRFRDPGRPFISEHPITGVRFADVRVPGMDAVSDLVRRAAQRVPGVRSVGWDVAVTSHGPVLIEGNHNWGSLLLEMAAPDGGGWNHHLTRHVPDLVYGGPCRHCRPTRRG